MGTKRAGRPSHKVSSGGWLGGKWGKKGPRDAIVAENPFLLPAWLVGKTPRDPKGEKKKKKVCPHSFVLGIEKK